MQNAPKSQLDPGEDLSDRQIGNVGESIAFLAVRSGSTPVPSTASLHSTGPSDPLSPVAKHGLDLLWLVLDPEDRDADCAWVQEVKTTCSQQSATYISSVRDDYDKLFGTKPSLTLNARLIELGFKLREMGLPELAERAEALVADSPVSADRVFAAPTGVHDRAADGLSVMQRVEAHLIAQGWPPTRLSPILIQVSELKARLDSLLLTP